MMRSSSVVIELRQNSAEKGSMGPSVSGFCETKTAVSPRFSRDVEHGAGKFDLRITEMQAVTHGFATGHAVAVESEIADGLAAACTQGRIATARQAPCIAHYRNSLGPAGRDIRSVKPGFVDATTFDQCSAADTLLN